MVGVEPLFHEGCGAVGRTVVDDDKFEVSVGLGEDGAQGVLYLVSLIVKGNDDADHVGAGFIVTLTKILNLKRLFQFLFMKQGGFMGTRENFGIAGRTEAPWAVELAERRRTFKGRCFYFKK